MLESPVEKKIFTDTHTHTFPLAQPDLTNVSVLPTFKNKIITVFNHLSLEVIHVQILPRPGKDRQERNGRGWQDRAASKGICLMT